MCHLICALGRLLWLFLGRQIEVRKGLIRVTVRVVRGTRQKKRIMQKKQYDDNLEVIPKVMSLRVYRNFW